MYHLNYLRRWMVIITMCAMVAAGCGILPTPIPTATPVPSATATLQPTSSPSPTSTPSPSVTPTATATPIPSPVVVVTMGQVRNAVTDEPVDGAQLVARFNTATSDVDGNFRIAALPTDPITVTASGYESLVITPQANLPVSVKLAPDPEATFRLIHKYERGHEYGREYDLLHPDSQRFVSKGEFIRFMELTVDYEILDVTYGEISYVDAWSYRGNTYHDVAVVPLNMVLLQKGQRKTAAWSAHLVKANGIWRWFRAPLQWPTPTPPPTAVPTPVPTPRPEDVAEKLRPSVVQLIVYDDSRTRISRGSGSIVSQDGLVLTNFHVVGHRDTGQLNNRDGYTYVAVSPRFEAPAEERYIARVIDWDTSLDFALLRIEADAFGRPLQEPLSLPSITLGNSDAVRVGSDLIILGYPRIGGATLTFTKGSVAGFEPDLGHTRGWMKVQATVSFGSSGGVAATTKGELIGVPTWIWTDRGGTLARLRPLNLARPLIERAGGEPLPIPEEGLPTGYFNLQWQADCAVRRAAVALGIGDENTCSDTVETRSLSWLGNALRDNGVLGHGESIQTVWVQQCSICGIVVKNAWGSRVGWIRIGGGEPGKVWRTEYHPPGRKVGPTCRLRLDYTWECR